MLKIHNLRAGFATNSSSSHSIVLIPETARVSSISASSDGYGWDHFRLTTAEEKLRYLAAQLVGGMSLKDMCSVLAKFEELIPGFADNFVDPSVEVNEEGELPWGAIPYVDHQSAFGNKVNAENIDEMIRFFMSPRVVVLGGNDNADYSTDSDERPNFPTGVGAEVFPGASYLMGGSGRVRLDGKFVTMMDNWSGLKMRFSFDADDPSASDYVKASAPELVDVKITNYCTKGCNFCYQSSTAEGVHAPYEEIIKVFDTLQALDVFEIAIGGGEPTSHPDFVRILEAAAERKLKPNFTTLSDAWLENDEILAAVNKNVGGIGVSCLDKKGLALVTKIEAALAAANRGYCRPKVMAQHVVGSVPIEVTGAFIDAAFAAKIAVLLLGYKEVGFGAEYTRHDTGQVETYLALAVGKHDDVSLSVDTALVDRYPGLMAALNVPEALVSSPEGKFSCYVDAVTGTMGASSYVQPSEMESFQADPEDFKKAFAAY